MSEPVFVDTTGGLIRMNTDGSGLEKIVDAPYGVLALGRGGRTFALGDSDTNLYIMHLEDRKVRRVPELDGRTGEAAVTPDGALVAATRHADFRTRQSTWHLTEDDSLYLIDSRSLAVQAVPKSTNQLVTSMAWSSDGGTLWLSFYDSSAQRFDLGTRTRAPVPEWPTDGLVLYWRREARTCETTSERIQLRGFGGDEGIDIESSDGTRRLVVIEGRKRGFHDYLPTITTAFFSESCRDVVFGFKDEIWVADVESGSVGLLLSGAREAFRSATR